LPHKRELEYAAQHLTTIEINGTFYRTQTPDSFKKWRDETPDNFVFSVKAPRYAVNKRVLSEAGPSVDRFMESGLHELGPKLGPVLWQFAATKKFDPEDFGNFVKLLPADVHGLPLHHALEVRHRSFDCEAFHALARDAKAAVVLADSDDYPYIDAKTGPFRYLRLMRTVEEIETGYSAEDLESWTNRIQAMASDGTDVFVYFISGAKVRAPAAAQAFLAQLSPTSEP
jgi:uncharacterized protein YecE (DUF72 family)